MNEVVVWRKFVYDTGECKTCGHVVRKHNGNPTDEVLMDSEKGILFCPFCLDIVGKMVKTDMTIEELLKHQMKNNGLWGKEL